MREVEVKIKKRSKTAVVLFALIFFVFIALILSLFWGYLSSRGGLGLNQTKSNNSGGTILIPGGSGAESSSGESSGSGNSGEENIPIVNTSLTNQLGRTSSGEGGGDYSGGSPGETFCIPNCAGKQCGDNGCSGICGPGCNSNEYCGNGNCFLSSCSDGVMNGDETRIDCGGNCEFSCPTNWNSGISVLFKGTPGMDYAEEYFWYDPIIDDHKVVYIKADTQIWMEHNERNKRQTNIVSPDSIEIGINGQDGIANSGDEGWIRYRIDRDLQLRYQWSGLVPIEDYSSRNDSYFDLSQNSIAQIFRVYSGAHLTMNITYLQVYVYRENDPGTLSVGINSLDANQKPTAQELCTGSVNSRDINQTGQWLSLKMNCNQTIPSSENLRYALIAKVSNPSAGKIYWLANSTGRFSFGKSYRLDSGNWNQINASMWFRMDSRGDIVCPRYQKPFSLSDLKYGTGYLDDNSSVAVVGATGSNSQAITNRSWHYHYGQLDEFGDEWHTMAYADDDEFIRYNPDGTWTTAHYEKIASDGKTLLFVVNPKTPAIIFKNLSSIAQFYTTPAKAYWVPKVHNQTTYLSDDVEIKLVNIMNNNSIYYRIDNGKWIEYSAPINSNVLSDGEHILDYYYDNNYHKTRKIVKNPDYPSKNEEHGNTLWKDANELDAIKLRLQRGALRGYKEWYNYIKTNDNVVDRNGHYTVNAYMIGGKRTKNAKALENAFIGLVEGNDYKCLGDNKSVAQYTKTIILDSVMNLDPLWLGDAAGSPDPSHELLYRGYYDAEIPFSNLFAYDILISNYKSNNASSGITAIEDYKIRDNFAQWSMRSLMQIGNQVFYMNRQNAEGMWGTARNMVSLSIGVVMPTYNTPYYGTSGFDGSSAIYKMTPYPDYPVTWKEAFFTETNTLYGFPNQAHRWDQDVSGSTTGPIILEENKTAGSLTLEPGNFMNRAGYMNYGNMGFVYQRMANVMKIKMNYSYPYLELAFNKIADGSFRGLQAGEYYQGPYILLVNKYFRDNDVALNADNYMKKFNSNEANSIWGQMSRNGAYSLILYDDAWMNESENITQGQLGALKADASILQKIAGMFKSFLSLFSQQKITGNVILAGKIGNQTDY